MFYAFAFCSGLSEFTENAKGDLLLKQQHVAFMSVIENEKVFYHIQSAL